MSRTTSETTALLGGTVLTIDERRRVFDPGAVLVAGDRIVAVDERDVIRETYTPDHTIELGGSVILPGLVDSHGHAGHGLTKGLGGGDADRWVETVTELYDHASTTAFWEAESYLAALEHLELGVTTSLAYSGSAPRVDDPKYALAAAKGYAELGLRHVVNVGPPDPPYPRSYTDATSGETREVDLDDAMATTARVLDTLDGAADGRLSVFVGPSSLVPEVIRDGEPVATGLVGGDTLVPATGPASAASVEQLEAVVDLAESTGTGVHAHAFRGQVEAAADAVPEILDTDLSLAHCADLTAEELELMAAHGIGASHGPLTHAYALAPFPLVEALDAGVTVAVSTDGSAPDRSFDLLSQGRIAAQLQRARLNDTAVLPAGKILEMLTIDAAKLLGLEEDVGSLEPGKHADLIAIDLHSAKLHPVTQLVHRVVHYADGGDVSFVMIDGEVRMRDGEVVDVDTEQILSTADSVVHETLERAGLEAALHPDANIWEASRY